MISLEIMGIFIDTVIMASVFFYIYFREKEEFLKIMAVSWGIYAVRFIFDYLKIFSPEAAGFWNLGIISSIYLHIYFLLWGTYLILPQYKFSRIKISFLLLIAFFSYFLFPSWLGFSELGATMLVFAVAGFFYIWAGILFLKVEKNDEELSFKFVGACLVIWGLHKLDYPFLVQFEFWRSWGYLFSATLTILTAVGFLMIYYQKNKAELQTVEKKFAGLMEKARDMILYVRYNDGIILDANQQAVDFYGYPKEELLRLSIRDLRAKMTAVSIKNQMDKAQKEGILFRTVHLKRSGEEVPVEVNSIGIFLKGEKVLLSIIRDISQQQAYEEKMRYLVHHDVLTKAKNRRAFEEDMQELETQQELRVGIILADINGLKKINDILGHKAGDRVIMEMTKRLNQCLREESDVYRIGGDEFAALLVEKCDFSIEAKVAQLKRCLQKINEKDEIKINCALGYALRSEETPTLEAVFKEADSKMYQEKRRIKEKNQDLDPKLS